MSRRNGNAQQDGCRIGPGGSSWFLVCRHVAEQGATAIPDPDPQREDNYLGSILCPQCDATLPQIPTSADMADLVAVCGLCCLQAGWLKAVKS
jgi:hypothetical protein